MLYKIKVMEDWGGDSRGKEYPITYITDKPSVVEVLAAQVKNLSEGRKMRPQMNQRVVSIEEIKDFDSII